VLLEFDDEDFKDIERPKAPIGNGARFRSLKRKLLSRKPIPLEPPGTILQEQQEKIRRLEDEQERTNDSLKLLAAFALKAAESKRERAKRAGEPHLPKTSDADFRIKIIKQAVEQGLTAQEYCRYLKSKVLQTRDSWRHKGCPADYVEAWNYQNITKRKKFRAWITNEKYKVGGKRRRNITSPLAR
jgi:uncharacterized membrane protein YqiK